MKFPLITLNETEQMLAMFLARKRDEVNRKNGVPQGQISTRPHTEVELDGIGAEIAYAKLMNVYPDMEFEHWPAEDCLTDTGETVDVKMTSRSTGDLLAAPYKKFKSTDIYAVLVGRFPEYRLVGHCRRDDVFRDDRLTTLNGREVYKVPGIELRPCVHHEGIHHSPME